MVGSRDRLDRFHRQLHTRGRGEVAEEAAVRWLESQGFRVVERNLNTRAGELDVVAWEGEVLCFVEVKARSSGRFGHALEAVGPAKQRRIIRAAALYLARSGHRGACRFDVLGLDRSAEGWRYSLVRNAFQAEERT